MRPAKIVAIVIGALLILVGIGVLAPGIILLSINGSYKDSSGFFSTSDRALSSSRVRSHHSRCEAEHRLWGLDSRAEDRCRSARLRAVRLPSSSALGLRTQVNEYLSGVAYDEVTNPEILSSWFSSAAEYRHHDGGAPSAPPGQQTFWVAEQEGQGTQTVQWNVHGGDWTAVLMNADASAPVNGERELRCPARLLAASRHRLDRCRRGAPGGRDRPGGPGGTAVAAAAPTRIPGRGSLRAAATAPLPAGALSATALHGATPRAAVLPAAAAGAGALCCPRRATAGRPSRGRQARYGTGGHLG